MKNLIILKIAIALLVLLPINTFSQINHFDSVRTIMSSNTYDYRNPLFAYTSQINYVQNMRLIYEVHSGNSSRLGWRGVDYWNYSGENFIVNNSYLNINSATHNDMVVWQSNKNGNWDLYFSIWGGNSWSAPAIVDSTPTSETNPSLYFLNYGYDTYYLLFEKNNDVYFKYYRNGSWQGDTNLTGSVALACHSPVFYGQKIYYLKQISSSMDVLNRQRFGIQYPNYNFVWYPVEERAMPNTVKNLRCSHELHFEYDTLGSTHSYMIGNHTTFTMKNMTLGFSGNNINCSGMDLMVPISDNPLLDFYPYDVFGFQRRTTDSNMIVALSNDMYNVIRSRRISLDDTSFVSKIIASAPVYYTFAFYKIRLVWEKKINGKVALVETFDIQVINDIKKISNNTPSSFSLSQNYPNPFNPSTTIIFNIKKSSDVKLIVYDIQGKEIAELVNEKLNAGSYEVEWNASDYPSGVYFYKMFANDFNEIKKMVLLK